MFPGFSLLMSAILGRCFGFESPILRDLRRSMGSSPTVIEVR